MTITYAFFYLWEQMRSSFLIFALLITGNTYSQLGFCSGSKGDPIFHEDFGPGIGTGAQLDAGITSYSYVTGDPNDGQYTISSRIGQDNGSWHPGFPQSTISNGRALVVNADEINAGMFYETNIEGLCEATTYEFSAFLINVYNAASGACSGTGIPINVRFEIWDETDSVLLKSGSTGDIEGTTYPSWEQYAMIFTSQAGQSNVILRMFNNGVGGCGNDLAIDDILFRSCGDLTEVNSDETNEAELVVCRADAPATIDLSANPDGAVYNSHHFQWQESNDGETWQDMPGETQAQLSTQSVSMTKFFRVKVAEDEVNLSNNLCSSASEAFRVRVVEIPNAPISEGDVEACEGEDIPPLKVQVEDDKYVYWYDTPTGGDFLEYGTTSFYAETPGTYYAEAIKLDADCDPGPRTAIRLSLAPIPEVTDEFLQICEGETLQLNAGAGNYAFEWSSGETTREITVSQSGNYSVFITNPEGCSAEKYFEIVTADVAGISGVNSDGNTVIIEPANEGDFEYSLDGINFQDSNIFEGISGGVYTAFQRDLSGCNTVSREFPHIIIPKFITPNNDGFNDQFELNGVEYFSNSEVRIFDRYGKLLAAGNGSTFSWDGSLNNRELPAADYWYHIFIDGFEPIKGHFTLKR